ncbi:HEAT repeat domain-containing protein, partial [Singulisphaera rosea]
QGGGVANAPVQQVANRRSPSGLRYEQDLNNLVSILDQATALYDSMRDRFSVLRGESRLRRMEMQLKMTFGLRPHRTMIFAPGEMERLKASHGERVRSALTRLFAAQNRFRTFTHQPAVVSAYPKLPDGRPDIDILFPAGVPVGDPVVATPSPAPAPTQESSEPAGNHIPANEVNRPAVVDEPPASGDFVDVVLHDLSSASPQKRKAALGRLSRAPANDRREEVAKAIEPMLQNPEVFERIEAAKVLAVWGGPENIPVLVKALKDPEVFVRWAVLDALKLLKDPSSADAIADAMKGNHDRAKAGEALREIGTPAEDAVLKCLNSGEMFLRMDACKILADIGTSKSIPALRKLAQRRNGLDGMAARDALNQIGNQSQR